MKIIYLADGTEVPVSDQDFPDLVLHQWHRVGDSSLSRPNLTGYAGRYLNRRRRKVILMHREILGAPTGVFIDHINQNKLDNRRENLRFCTESQNQANRKKFARNPSSEFLGVFLCKGRWRARTENFGKTYNIGSYSTEVEAAIARDRKAYELWGEYAHLNFPELIKQTA